MLSSNPKELPLACCSVGILGFCVTFYPHTVTCFLFQLLARRKETDFHIHFHWMALIFDKSLDGVEMRNVDSEIAESW
jgi:hypothetical protein